MSFKSSDRLGLRTFNNAWDESNNVLTLVPYRFNPIYLEGKTYGDRDIMVRAKSGCVIHSEAQYNDLLKIVSNWGFCVETPADFSFQITKKHKNKVGSKCKSGK